jgi:c-di-GMP-binding flagellar brake protein YcgR
MIPAIVARFARRPAKTARLERRARKRIIPTQITPCQFTTCEGEPVESALVHDLSADGAGILSEQGFEPGTIVHLLLVNANHTFALSLEFEVVRATRNPAGTYFLGGRFTRPLRHEELVPFLS